MTTPRPLLLLAALFGAISLTAAGCGGTATAVPTLSSFQQVADASVATGSARFSIKVEASIPGAEKPFSFSADGGFDTVAKRAQVTVDLSSLAALFESLGASLGGSPAGAPSDAGAWKLEAIVDGSVAYIHFPQLADRLPPGKTWVRGDAKDLSSANGGELGQFGSFAGTDPKELFHYLAALSGTIETVGTEELHGVETSHYRAAVDLTKLAALVPPDQRLGLAGLDQLLGKGGIGTIPVDVWVDAEQRMRKLVLDLRAAPAGSGEGLHASLEMELFDYGRPLDLTLPPADQVVDANTLERTP